MTSGMGATAHLFIGTGLEQLTAAQDQLKEVKEQLEQWVTHVRRQRSVPLRQVAQVLQHLLRVPRQNKDDGVLNCESVHRQLRQARTALAAGTADSNMV